MNNLVSYLFETNAVKICEENKPFWLASGMLSPYFINTHYIYGSAKEAEDLLAFIETEDKLKLPRGVLDKTLRQYNENEIYRDVINQMKEFIEKNINVEEIDYISGGERRDWFFSNLISYFLNKPHISIHKDLSIVISDSKFETTTKSANLNGKKVLHVADLITVASSYLRAWIPAIENLGAKTLWSVAVVDRLQGGEAVLKEQNITPFAMVGISPELFAEAQELNYISPIQLEMLNDFLGNPEETMRNFLIAHPEYIEITLNGTNEKAKARAELCKEGNLYNL